MATYAFVELPQLEETRALADYTSIEFDLRAASEFAELLLSELRKPEPNWSLSDPLTVATTVRYARSFTTGVRLRLNHNMEGRDFLTPEQIQKHEYILAVRDKYIAHSVNAFEESGPVARYCVERVKEEGITSIDPMHRRVVGFSEHDLEDIRALAAAWLGYVRQKLNDERARLLPIIREMPLEEVLQGGREPSVLDTSQPQIRRKHF
jgi:hypothetical protein